MKCKRDKASANQEDIGTARTELFVLVCDKVAKIRDANFHRFQYLCDFLTS